MTLSLEKFMDLSVSIKNYPDTYAYTPRSQKDEYDRACLIAQPTKLNKTIAGYIITDTHNYTVFLVKPTDVIYPAAYLLNMSFGIVMLIPLPDSNPVNLNYAYVISLAKLSPRDVNTTTSDNTVTKYIRTVAHYISRDGVNDGKVLAVYRAIAKIAPKIMRNIKAIEVQDIVWNKLIPIDDTKGKDVLTKIVTHGKKYGIENEINLLHIQRSSIISASYGLSSFKGDDPFTVDVIRKINRNTIDGVIYDCEGLKIKHKMV